MNFAVTGIIFDIKRYAIHDGPGIRTTIFFKGCPMECWWCHNPESRDIQPQKSGNSYIGRKVTYAEVLEEVKKDTVFYEESGGGVTFSGGEPLMQPEFLLNCLQACGKAGIHTTIDTCGYADKNVIEKILPYTDLFLFDVKLINTNEHQKYTGVPNNLIIENLKLMVSMRKAVHVRIPVIPGVNDRSNIILDTIKFLKDISGIKKINLLPYHKIGAHKYERLGMRFKAAQIEEPSDAQMESIKKQFESAGFPVSIGG